jgi:hypothetical protein
MKMVYTPPIFVENLVEELRLLISNSKCGLNVSTFRKILFMLLLEKKKK